MIKLVFALIFTALVVLFTLQNMRPVSLYILFHEPVNINLVLLILISFALGGLTVFFSNLIKQVNHKNQIKKLKKEEASLKTNKLKAIR